MIEKIVSGGRPGAERAALDVAVELGIPCGGAIPPGAEERELTDRYGLSELAEGGFDAALEKNVIDSDGTLIISAGRPFGDADHARRLALQHRRQLLHIDAARTDVREAASLARSWIDLYHLKTVHVAGCSADNPIRLSAATLHILSYLLAGESGQGLPEPGRPYPLPDSERPGTVEAAVRRLISEMPLKERAALAGLEKEALPFLHPSLVDFIVIRFGLEEGGNSGLMDSCRFVAREKSLSVTGAAEVIIRALWADLRRTHTLRVVK
jgi:hypothetical protein